MTTIIRRPLAAQAADVLMERIQAGEWALGQRLPGEILLATQLGVGRSTVREAIRHLAGQGVLDSRQGAGVFVTSLEATEDWDAVVRRASITAVIEARIAIETEAAALAAERRTPAQLRALRHALAERDAASSPAERYVDADMALHRAIVHASANAVLLELFDGFVPRIRQAMIEMVRMLPAPGADDHAAHAALVEAIAAREPARAAELSRAHLAALRAALA